MHKVQRSMYPVHQQPPFPKPLHATARIMYPVFYILILWSLSDFSEVFTSNSDGIEKGNENCDTGFLYNHDVQITSRPLSAHKLKIPRANWSRQMSERKCVLIKQSLPMSLPLVERS